MPKRALWLLGIAVLAAAIVATAVIAGGLAQAYGGGPTSRVSASPSSTLNPPLQTTTTSDLSQRSEPPPTSAKEESSPVPSNADGGCIPGHSGEILVVGSYKGFFPASLNITVGQTVTFTMGPMAFTCSFNQVGLFLYHCTDHPYMTEKVEVRG